MLLLNADEVSALLDMDALVDALGPAMVELSAGRVSMPPRTAALVEGKGLLGTMPAYLPSSRTLSCKLVTVFPGNAALDLHTHQAVVLLFDADTGTPKAMLDGASITALRTAAGSALATKLLARGDASTLLIIGTGVQALSHARAMLRVRDFREVRVASRDVKKAERVARLISEEFGVHSRYILGGHALVFEDVDVVCACTHAEQPVVRGEWLEPGMHVNSVGLNPQGRELDAEAVQKARVFVESRAAALAPPPSGAGDLAGAAVHEIGEVLAGTQKGRESEQQITLYKSVGVAVQDAVAAQLVYDAALKRGAGRKVAF
ncbi:MAG TPA: ornithine cyclodeaminase family protein [Gammaproteobacteria bacterium]|nr:ornithine cyclodeaminase family protein [Gammaproteobacteria bacterium]